MITFKTFCEEYVYMYDSEALLNQIHADFVIVRQVIDNDVADVKSVLFRDTSERRSWEEIAAEHNNKAKLKEQLIRKKLYGWLVFFHEVEYKRYKLIQHDLDTKECDKVIITLYKEYVEYFASVIHLYHELHDLDDIQHTDDMIALETYNKLHNTLQKLRSVKSIKDMIIEFTMSLNVMHHSGSLFEDYSYISFEDLDNLSNLDSRRWNLELHKEFQI